MNCRKSLALLLCMLCLSVTAQQLGTWRLHLSYYIATKSEAGGSTIYSLMNGNLLSYDTEDGEVRTYDHMDILSDVGIAYIAYSNEADKLLIVYNNGNIDLLDKDDNVQNLSSLKDKTMLNKEVANVSIAGSMAYLATGFGFVEVDMKEGVFRNTYRLPYTIHCITASDEAVFIGTPEGIRYCLKDGNMQLEENWKIRLGWGGFNSMHFFQNKLVAKNQDGIFVLDPYNTSKQYRIARGNFTSLKQTGKQLFWHNKTTYGYTSDVSGTDEASLNAAVTTISYENNWSDVSHVNGTYWMSEQEKGLRGYKMSGNEFIPTEEVIQPSSPIRDLGYNVSWAGDRLLVAGGINTVGSFENPATSMYYENGEWTNFTELERTGRFAKVTPVNTTDLVQDPLDDTHHFASPYRSGLCEYRNGKFVELYNPDNSPLKSIQQHNPASSWYYKQVLCSALSYDADGNLWMAQSMLDTTFYVRKPDGNWFKLRYNEMSGSSLIDKILHHSSGIKLVSSRRLEKRGVFCIDMKGTERTTDDKTRLLQDFVNQDNTPYLPDQFFCLCEDLEGMVWVGTSAGLFVIEDVTKVFDKDFYFTQIKINRNDGSGLADYLFNDVSISCIAIDAANRKWIGTQANGAYLISADGQEMLHHFTTEDSPLLSNNVQSIAVHPGTGEVAFGTDKGICTFISDATTPEEELEKSNVVVFPNPVTPDYNGPIAIRGLVENSEVKIISTGGQLVWNGTSSGGTCTWNGVANNGKPVASGIYHVVANTPEGGKAIMTRIVIVR
ncbi:MAG: regulator [Bacteroidaceae bacterium]|nr:regulator [Bacteroidaceae bacterium]